MKINIKDWNTDMKIRLLDKMSNWHLKHFDKESGRFLKPSVYNWSDRNNVDYNGKSIKSPDYMWHELDYEPRYVIYDGDTQRFGGHICYSFKGNEYKVVLLPYHHTCYPNIKEEGRKYPYPCEFECDRDSIPLDYYWCCKIERYIDKFRGRQVYHNNIEKFLAVDIMKHAYEMYVFLDDYKYRINEMIDICTKAYKNKVRSDMLCDRMRQLERKADENFWTSEEIEKKSDDVCKSTKATCVFCPYTFPIIKEIEEAMSYLKYEIICNFRSELYIKKDFEPIFIEAFGLRTAEHILYGN